MPLLFVFAMLLGQVKESPIVCNLNALTPTQREVHAQLTARLKAAVTKTEDVGGGYRFHLSATLPSADLFQWVDFEQRCCPFLDFEIRIDREDGERRLQLTGRTGAKQLIAAEFEMKDQG
jgi:hypothetical protein